MAFSLVQFRDESGARHVAASTEGAAVTVPGVQTTYRLAMMALASGQTLAETVEGLGRGDPVDLRAALREGRLLAPLVDPRQKSRADAPPGIDPASRA